MRSDTDRMEAHNTSSDDTQHDGNRIFGQVAKVIPYFRKKRNVLLFKLDIMLLLWMFVAGLIKELDQSATTQAYVSGMREDLGLYSNELVNFTTFFSIGYAIGLIPGQIIQTRIRPSLFLPCCEITWGLLVLFTHMAPNAHTIYALRFFLGLLSASFWPSVVALIFNWYKPSELAIRLAFFNVSDVAGAMFLGVLQATLYRDMNGVHGLSGWMWLFVIAGAITIGQGLLAFITIPDSPAITRAVWLTKAERQLARDRMDEFGATTSRMVPVSVLKVKLRQLIVHPVTYFVMISFALSAWSSRANSYFVLYLETIKDSAGNRKYSTYDVNIMPLGGYALQIATSLAFNWLSDWKHWRWQISVFSALASAIVLAVLSSWPSSSKTVLAFYFLTYATNAGNPSLMAWLAELLRKEPEARSIIVAMTVTLVYFGHATIPLGAWRVADAPQYPIGFPMATVMSAMTVFTLLGLLWWTKKHPEIAERGYSGLNVPEEADQGVKKGDVEVGKGVPEGTSELK